MTYQVRAQFSAAAHLKKPETVRRVRQRIATVLQWAIAIRYPAYTSCERLTATLGRQRHVVQHMRALSNAEVAEAAMTFRASEATRS